MYERMVARVPDLGTSEFKAHRFLSGADNADVYAPSFRYVPDFGWSSVARGSLRSAYLASKPRVLPLDQELLYTYADIAGEHAQVGSLTIEDYGVVLNQSSTGFIVGAAKRRILQSGDIPAIFDILGFQGYVQQTTPAASGQCRRWMSRQIGGASDVWH